MIKNKLLTKLKNLTQCEMDLFLYLVRRQNPSGDVFGVHNQAVCKNTKMSKQSFYNALEGLQNKDIITYEKGSKIDYNVTILDNDFSYPGAKKEGYVDLQRSVYHKKAFKKLKANEKFLVLWFIHITNENTGSHKIKIDKFYKKYMDMLGVTRRVIRSYIHSIKSFFSIGVKNGIMYITYLHSVFKAKLEVGHRRSANENFVESLCRRLKFKNVSYKDIKDTAYLLVQYATSYEWCGRKIEYILTSVIAKVALLEKKPKNRKLNAAYIHKLVRIELGLDEAVNL